jgi:hypothetical protein
MSVSSTFAAEQESEGFSDAELAQILAPIALYPDSLLTHILISSTYPIEVIEAYRWLQKNNSLSNEQRSQLLDEFDWDASVKALIPFEHVLSRLSEDLSWTQSLGDAFLQDESRLLLSIQTLRKQAKVAGSLKNMDKMDISYEDNNIIILPKEKEVVYIPYYDSRAVYGSWLWAGYPPVYWNSNHRRRGGDFRHFYWASGIHITFNYFFSDFHWHNRHVVVVAPHRAHYRKHSSRPRRLIVREGYAKRWSHKPSHRKGVAYKTKKTAAKYHSNRVGVHRSKQLNTNDRNLKQRLRTDNHSSNKSNKSNNRVEKNQKKSVQKRIQKSPNKRENTTVKQGKFNSGVEQKTVNKKFATSQKVRNTNTHKSNKNSQTSQKIRQKSPTVNNRTLSTERKSQHRFNKGSSFKGGPTKRNHSGNSKERK